MNYLLTLMILANFAGLTAHAEEPGLLHIKSRDQVRALSPAQWQLYAGRISPDAHRYRAKSADENIRYQASEPARSWAWPPLFPQANARGAQPCLYAGWVMEVDPVTHLCKEPESCDEKRIRCHAPPYDGGVCGPR